MKSRAAIFVAACCVAAPPSHGEPPESVGSYCAIELPEGRNDLRVKWIGDCRDGKADGLGSLATAGMLFSGKFHKGKPEQAEGRMVRTTTEGIRETVRILGEKGKWRIVPLRDGPDAVRLPLAPLVGNWKLESGSADCAEYHDYGANGVLAMVSPKVNSSLTFELHEVAARPGWMLMLRTATYPGGGDRHCSGESVYKLFETREVFVNIDTGGKLHYCESPDLERCSGIAVRAPAGEGKPRNIITARAGSSRGINTATPDRGFGGGAGRIGMPAPGSASQAPPKSNEVIDLTLDRNKGALYALYGRALREDPELQGKFTFEATVQTTGEFTDCRVVSSELHHPELEKKLCARINLNRSPPIDSPLTIVKSFDFFPAQ